jgi:hypothetical protein
MMAQKHLLPTAQPENSERISRLIKLTARLVDKILVARGSDEAIARSKPDE